MRIIGGKLKGKKLFYLDLKVTRPLRDYVKENIFNIICHSKAIEIKIKGSKILDLFSGSGPFGIECLSREAQFTTFVEKDKDAMNIIRKNIHFLSIEKNTNLFQTEINHFLEERIDKEKYDIIFLDPPYSNTDYIKNIKKIKELKCYNKKHLIILHRDINSKEIYDNFINIIFIKKYGRSKVIFGFIN